MAKIANCCTHNTRQTKCIRKDKKTFRLPRRFSRKRCMSGPVRGFTMRSSCAPYKYCKTIRRNGNERRKRKGKRNRNR